MRLIDADALKEGIKELKQSPWYNNDINPSWKQGIKDAVHVVETLCIDEEPTVDAVPVRHGKWIGNSPVTMRCNQCTYVASDWIVHEFHYCPNCGARMDGDRDEPAKRL